MSLTQQDQLHFILIVCISKVNYSIIQLKPQKNKKKKIKGCL